MLYYHLMEVLNNLTFKKIFVNMFYYYDGSVACLPHARTVEPRKPRNTHATIELRL
jgi:hypothetical protein